LQGEVWLELLERLHIGVPQLRRLDLQGVHLYGAPLLEFFHCFTHLDQLTELKVQVSAYGCIVIAADGSTWWLSRSCVLVQLQLKPSLLSQVFLCVPVLACLRLFSINPPVREA